MPFIQLAILSSIMFITTFLIGSLPLSLSNNLNPIRFHQLSIFGVGLLVGAALSIVIPEGIDAIYNSDPTIDPSSSSISQIHHRAHYHHNSQVGLTLMAGFILMFLIHQLTTSSQIKSKKKPAQSSNSKSDPSQTQALLSQPWNDDGLGLETGSSHPSRNPISTETDSSCIPNNNHQSKTKNKSTRFDSFSTVVGLLTHSIADGIAMGASSSDLSHNNANQTSKGLSLNMIIFIAIMVHKAPAAFGLVTVLMSEGCSRALVRKILLAFSLAAPFGALATWAGLALIHRIQLRSAWEDLDDEKAAEMQWWIGMTLLFSGGTFLFVATHTLQRTPSSPIDSCCIPLNFNQRSTNQLSQEESPTHQIEDDQSKRKAFIGPLSTSVLMVTGMLVPWLLTSLVGGHHHD